jgi:hypothetical protein
MKINEVMARDNTKKDGNGNFIGFDAERKVWVTIPRDVGKYMINKGELKDGALMVKTNYPEFAPSTGPVVHRNPQQGYDTNNPNFGAYAKNQLGQLKPKNIAKNVSNKMNQAGIDAVEKLKKVPAAAGDWLDRDAQKQRSRGGDFTG